MGNVRIGGLVHTLCRITSSVYYSKHGRSRFLWLFLSVFCTCEYPKVRMHAFPIAPREPCVTHDVPSPSPCERAASFFPLLMLCIGCEKSCIRIEGASARSLTKRANTQQLHFPLGLSAQPVSLSFSCDAEWLPRLHPIAKPLACTASR